jgi:hypothetical protein
MTVVMHCCHNHWSMINQLHKRSVFGLPARWPIRAGLSQDTQATKFYPYSFFTFPLSTMQNSTALHNQSLTGILVFLGVRNPRGGYCYIRAHTPALSRSSYHRPGSTSCSSSFQQPVELVAAQNRFLCNEGLLSVSRLSICPHDSNFQF